MVHLATLRAQEEYFEKHREEIFNLGKRFAVISVNGYKGYNTREKVYEDYPLLNPNSKQPVSGTFPKLVDIGKETNSLEYRKEKLENEKEKCKKDLIRLIRKQNELCETEKEILREEKLLRKNIS